MLPQLRTSRCMIERPEKPRCYQERECWYGTTGDRGKGSWVTVGSLFHMWCSTSSGRGSRSMYFDLRGRLDQNGYYIAI